MVKDLKKLENCALLFMHKIGKDGKAHDNMCVQLPNGKLIQVKQAFYDSRELSGLKLICGVNYPKKEVQVAPVEEVKEEEVIEEKTSK